MVKPTARPVDRVAELREATRAGNELLKDLKVARRELDQTQAALFRQMDALSTQVRELIAGEIRGVIEKSALAQVGQFNEALDRVTAEKAADIIARFEQFYNTVMTVVETAVEESGELSDARLEEVWAAAVEYTSHATPAARRRIQGRLAAVRDARSAPGDVIANEALRQASRAGLPTLKPTTRPPEQQR